MRVWTTQTTKWHDTRTKKKKVKEINESKTQRARAFDIVDRDDEWEAGRLLREWESLTIDPANRYQHIWVMWKINRRDRRCKPCIAVPVVYHSARLVYCQARAHGSRETWTFSPTMPDPNASCPSRQWRACSAMYLQQIRADWRICIRREKEKTTS